VWFIVQVYNIATPMAITLKVVVCIHNYMVLIEDFFLYEYLIFSLDLVIVILFVLFLIHLMQYTVYCSLLSSHECNLSIYILPSCHFTLFFLF